MKLDRKTLQAIRDAAHKEIIENSPLKGESYTVCLSLLATHADTLDALLFREQNEECGSVCNITGVHPVTQEIKNGAICVRRPGHEGDHYNGKSYWKQSCGKRGTGIEAVKTCISEKGHTGDCLFPLPVSSVRNVIYRTDEDAGEWLVTLDGREVENWAEADILKGRVLVPTCDERLSVTSHKELIGKVRIVKAQWL